MSIKNEFLAFFDDLVKDIEVPENVRAYVDAIRDAKEDNKPLFTDNGKLILEYLQGVQVMPYKAKDIADNIGITSKSVSGAMRKLVTDGYIEKVGKNPVVYVINEKGINVNFKENNENND